MTSNLPRIVSGLTGLLVAGSAWAVPTYVGLVPNASVNSCSTCHAASGPPALNPFGTAFMNNGHVWNSALAVLDSDNDGFKNGQELGDPTGSGTPIPGAQVTLPGDPNSKPVLTPPNISISSPANGASFSPPFTGPVTAASTTPAAMITAVQFFSGSTLLGTDTSSPYSLAVNLPAGGYTLTARAIDYLGASNTSAAVTITVSAPAVAPAIVTPPASQTVTAGANVTFTVSASGTPPLSYQWQKNTANISGATGSTLTLNAVTASDAGSYRVVVTNVAGSATSAAASLTVNPAATAPSITLQPVSQTVNAGANVSFVVGASGTAPLSYQWQKNMVNIPGANSATLNLTAVTTADAGSYRAVVTNTAGSATSSAATLTVNQTTVVVSITSPTNGASFNAPANFPLTASATPAGSVSRVDFYQGSTLLGSVTTTPYAFNVMNLGAGSYTYTARALSTGGTTTTSAPVNITVTSPPPPTGPATVTITANDPNAAEAGPDPGSFRVARTGPTTNNLTVFYLIGGTAANGLDYQAISNYVTIPMGSATADIAIRPIADMDTPTELSDTVILQLTGPPTSQPAGYTIGSPSNAVVTIQEAVTGDTPPVVSLISPRSGSSFRAPATILLVASASDPDGTVTKVDFYAGTTLIGTGTRFDESDDSEEPEHEGSYFAFRWRDVSAGQYVLTAVATDNGGATTISSPASITVRSREGGGDDAVSASSSRPERPSTAR